MRVIPLLALAALSVFAPAADACTEDDVQGPYASHLSGVSTISGTETPFANLGRLVFDGEGNIGGYSSINFNGLLLGNPVTGTYEVNSDCTMSWKLQDDSGAFQHFSGIIKRGGQKVEFRQTDAGAGGRGTMEKTAEGCDASDLRERYAFTLSGVYTPLAPDGASGPISAEGVVHLRADGSLTLGRRLRRTGSSAAVTAEGTFNVEQDCIVNFEFTPPAGDGQAAIPMKLRGILVNGGREIIAIQTDPGETASARFTVR